MAVEGESARLARTLGGVPAWWVIGPFDNEGGKGFRTAYPPEKRIDIEAAHRGEDGVVRWQLKKPDSPWGDVNLKRVISRKPWVVAYAVCWATSPRPQTVQMRLGSDDDVVVWVGGREVWRKEILRGLKLDDDIVPVSLPAGTTPILVKVCQRLGEWGFCLRFTDETGAAARNLTFSTKPR